MHHVRFLPALALLLATGTASAWDFPEHAELTRFALDHKLPDPARAVIEHAVREAGGSLGLCAELTMPLAELDERVPCIPFSVLAALAGDHSIDTKTLREALTVPEAGERKPLARRVTAAVVPMFAEYLKSSARDVVRLYRSDVTSDAVHSDGSGNADQRVFLRRMDIRLQAIDPGYTSRAGGSRAHFQDATRTMDSILRSAATSGDLGNALAQLMAHHARSLQLAAKASTGGVQRGPLVAEALLEHALAVHFLQDAFAAGHIGTEPALVEDVTRLRRHDFLNRVGLSVTRAFSTRACQSPLESFARAEGCWIAYGDGYLDWNNAQIVANATARLEAQLAMALDATMVSEALRSCSDENPNSTKPLRVVSNTLRHHTGSPDPSGDIAVSSEVQGAHVVHTYRLQAIAGARFSIAITSTAFDTYVEVSSPSGESLRNDNADVLTTDSRIDIANAQEGTYVIRVSAVNPDIEGGYELRVSQVDDSPKSRDCTTALALYDLLDPAPTWAISESARHNRELWTQRDREKMASSVVRGVAEALAHLAATDLLKAATGDRESGAKPGTLRTDVLESPLDPCRPATRWGERAHPLCRDSGTEFRFGDFDASLWRPVLVIWPGPTADVRIGEGEDSFGYGFAFQVLYGGGGAIGVTQAQVPWAIGPFFGGGISLRADSLFPSRVNRELFAVDAGVIPAFTAGLTTRYATLLFAEARVPVWAALGAWAFGREASVGPVEFGPTGFRCYWEAPQHLPGGGGQFLGWDVEILNIRLNAVQATRTASLGSRMDTELRFRVGHIMLKGLDEPDTPSVWTLGAEVAAGYSVFWSR